MNNQIKIEELFRFLVGGGSAVITDYIVYKLLLAFIADMSVSKAVSYICGAVVGFIINKLWTFESKIFSGSEIVKYILLYAISAGINTGINKIIMLFMGMQLLAFLCATGASTVINFVGQKFFVFVKKRSNAK